MTNTPNRNYALQVTGTNVGTWGNVLNLSVFDIIDANLGATLNINVGGNSNINLTTAQSQNLIHNLTGVLTGNINYVFPAQGGFFTIFNNTTGAYTVTATVVGGTGIAVSQGSRVNITIDASVPIVFSPTGTNAGVGGQLAYYPSSGTVVSGDANATISAGALTLGVATSVQGSLILSGSTSGTTTIAAPVAGTGTMTLQAGNDTLIARATTDILTNKTFDTAGTGNSLEINGNGITAISGNTGTVATTTGALVSGNLPVFDSHGNIHDTGYSVASSSVFGVCKVDNTTITASAGVLSAVPSSLVVTAGGVGSIILATSGSSVARGATIAGSSLTVKQFGVNGSSAGAVANGDTVSGTWQALQTYQNGPFNIGIWQRTV